MARTEPFDKHAKEYDSWFDEHRAVYQSELNAIRAALSQSGLGQAVEIGAGTGRFAVPLGIKLGVEPSAEMASIARQRGMEILIGVAENLPLPDDSCDSVLFVTTICFVDDPRKSFQEARRVLRPGGQIIVGFIDANSPIGRLYQERKEASVFYRDARFYAFSELRKMLLWLGFKNVKVWQTLFKPLKEIPEPEPVKEGFGSGSFLVIRAEKPIEERSFAGYSPKAKGKKDKLDRASS